MKTETHTPERATPETDAFAESLTVAKVPASRAWPHWYDKCASLERQRDELLEALKAIFRDDGGVQLYSEHEEAARAAIAKATSPSES